jgi:hypothetical protein
VQKYEKDGYICSLLFFSAQRNREHKVSQRRIMSEIEYNAISNKIIKASILPIHEFQLQINGTL